MSLQGTVFGGVCVIQLRCLDKKEHWSFEIKVQSPCVKGLKNNRRNNVKLNLKVNG